MFRLIPVVLCSIAFCVQAQAIPGLSGVIDLDKPGALAALQRDNPKHYDEVLKKVDEAQAVPVTDQGLQNLGLLVPPPGLSGPSGNLKLSDPAKSRITVVVDGTTYLLTVRFTKNPATLVPAR